MVLHGAQTGNELLLHVPYAGRPSEPLGIADTSESEVLGISEVLFDITVEQRQLAL